MSADFTCWDRSCANHGRSAVGCDSRHADLPRHAEHPVSAEGRSITQRIADVLAEHGFRTCQGCIDAAMEDAALDTTDPPRTRRLAHVAAAIQAELQLTEERRAVDANHDDHLVDYYGSGTAVWVKPLHGYSCDCDNRAFKADESRAVTPWRAEP